MNQVLLLGLTAENPDLVDTIRCTMYLNQFNRQFGFGAIALIDRIPNVLPHPTNHELEVEFITETFRSDLYRPIHDAKGLIEKGQHHLEHAHNPTLDLKFQIEVANYYSWHAKMPLPEIVILLEKALALAISLGDPYHKARILETMGNIHWKLRQFDPAKRCAQEARNVAQGDANFLRESYALRTEAMCLVAAGDYKNASSLLSRGRELLVLSGNPLGAHSRNLATWMAEMHWLKTEYLEATMIHLERTQGIVREHVDYLLAFACLDIAQINLEINEPDSEVQLHVDRAHKLFDNMLMTDRVFMCQSVLAAMQLRQGSAHDAKQTFGKCLNFSLTSVSHRQITYYCLERLGDTRRWDDTEFEWSSKYTVIYLAFSTKTESKLDLHKALRCLGDILLKDGDDQTAENLFLVALEGFTFMDVHQSRAECMLRLGDLSQKRGDTSAAAHFWQDSRPLFERSLQTTRVSSIDRRLHELQTAIGEVQIGCDVVEKVKEIAKSSTDSPSDVSYVIKFFNPVDVQVGFRVRHNNAPAWQLWTVLGSDMRTNEGLKAAHKFPTPSAAPQHRSPEGPKPEIWKKNEKLSEALPN
ncbi:hypothetical protein FB45DRAFT_1007623 [Roridomyces roridus]|uniref:Uncharacterized protein n=1 Tax=Roridomyces roridus TaxID=1738132 RepID=A0AAD7FDR0_9AGAR|nr:hypothetical protein FB45DRAFT_1007623 [Roridomyces roridus]